jgi:adenylate cyclase
MAYDISHKSLALDESLDTPHSVLGLIYCFMRKYDKAVEEGQRAVSLNPNGADSHAFMGMILTFTGRHQDAIASIQKAMRLDPMPVGSYYAFLGAAYNGTDQYNKAIAVLKKGLISYPNDRSIYMVLVRSHGLAGNWQEAREAAANLLRLYPTFSVDKAKTPFKDRARAEKIREVYRKAGLK